ncbi:MAG TPA: hypothetical protein VGY66_21460 [Gemmataceae bacterium]|jgi:hypothetical protein|nr:hypothetical protein [Gemmataceae bacterium]
MRKLLKRWYVWLGLVLLLGLAGSATLILANPSRITQANFDRIHKGMSLDEVKAILGEWQFGTGGLATTTDAWVEGENWISVEFTFDGGKATVCDKSIHLATAWETLQWYAKKGAAKIGVKWQ